MSNLVLEQDPAKRPGFRFVLPGSRADMAASWVDWAAYHAVLGQELAKRMRVYPGPADQEEPPPGGTPVAMRMAA